MKIIKLSFKSVNELNKVFNILLSEFIVDIVLSGLNTLIDLKDDNLTLSD